MRISTMNPSLKKTQKCDTSETTAAQREGRPLNNHALEIAEQRHMKCFGSFDVVAVEVVKNGKGLSQRGPLNNSTQVCCQMVKQLKSLSSAPNLIVPAPIRTKTIQVTLFSLRFGLESHFEG